MSVPNLNKALSRTPGRGSERPLPTATVHDVADRSIRSLRVQLPSEILHDLRTPLNQILGYSEMLVEQAEEDGFASLTPDLQKISASGRRLLGIINSSFETAVAGGSIEAEAPQSSVQFPGRFPDPPAESIASAEELAVPASPLVGTVLVVDDNEPNRDVLMKRLVRQGHEVVVAVGGLDALEKMRLQSFDLVLLDIMMPDVDGFEVLRQIKNEPGWRHVPVLMISAMSDVGNIARCIAMGADDYLTKPFDQTLLKARVGACLEKKRAHDREIRLFDELKQNYVRLKALKKQRDDLTFMIVNDLRLPLDSMVKAITGLGLIRNLSSNQQEMLENSTSEGSLLLGTIDDLLDIEKLASSATLLTFVPVSIPDIIASAVAQVSNLAEGKRISIDYDVANVLPPICADARRLSRTMVNLIGNAIKFTPADGKIMVAAMPGDDFQSLEISVSDMGEPIPADSLPTIFEKFTHVTTGRGGQTMSTGLGLAFCKLVVEAHGGSIGVRSESDIGNIFTFTLPLLRT